jgi:hypothetical protein
MGRGGGGVTVFPLAEGVDEEGVLDWRDLMVLTRHKEGGVPNPQGVPRPRGALSRAAEACAEGEAALRDAAVEFFAL